MKQEDDNELWLQLYAAFPNHESKKRQRYGSISQVLGKIKSKSKILH